MAYQIGALEVVIRTDIGQFVGGMRTAASAVDQSAGRMAASTGRAAESVTRLERGVAGFSSGGDPFRGLVISALRAETGVKRLENVALLVPAALGGMSASLAAKGLMNYADTASTVSSRIRTVIEDRKQQNNAEREGFDIAQRTRTSYASTIQLFARTTQAAQQLGRSQGDLLRFSETVQKTNIISGSTSQEAAAGAIQLAQGLSSGRLQGDELRSILENNLELSNILAQELAGGDKGRLRQMGTEGLLTANNVIDAVLRKQAEVDRKFGNSAPLISQGFTVLDNALTKYVGQVDKAIGGSAALFKLLSSAANNLPNITSGVLGLAAAMTALAVGKGLRAGGSVVVGALGDVKQRVETGKDTLRAAIAENAALTRLRDQRQREAAIESAKANTIGPLPQANTADFTRAVADARRAQKQLDAVNQAVAESEKKALAVMTAPSGQARGFKESVAREARFVDDRAKLAAKLEKANRALAGASNQFSAAVASNPNVSGVKGLREYYKAAFDQSDAKSNSVAADRGANNARAYLAALNKEMRDAQRSGDSARVEAISALQDRAAEPAAAARALRERTNAQLLEADRRLAAKSETITAASEARKYKEVDSAYKARAAIAKQAASLQQQLAEKDARIAEEQISRAASQQTSAARENKARTEKLAEIGKQQAALAPRQASAQTGVALSTTALDKARVAMIASSAVNMAENSDKAALAAQRLAGAQEQVAASATRLQAAKVSLGAAMATTGNVFRLAASTVGQLGSSLAGALGGPWGVALTAISVGMGVFAAQTARAADAAAKGKERMQALLDTASSFKDLQAKLGVDPTSSSLASFNKDAAEGAKALKANLIGLRGALPGGVGGNKAAQDAMKTAGIDLKSIGMKDQSAALQDLLKIDDSSLRNLLDTLTRIAATDPGYALQSAELRGFIDEAIRGRAAFENFGKVRADALMSQTFSANDQLAGAVDPSILYKSYSEAISRARASVEAAAPAFKQIAESITAPLTEGAQGLDLAARMGITGPASTALAEMLARLQELKTVATQVNVPAFTQLVNDLAAGAVTAEQFKTRVTDIANAEPGIASVKRSIEETGRNFGSAKDTVDRLQQSINGLTGRVVDIVMRVSQVMTGATDNSARAAFLRSEKDSDGQVAAYKEDSLRQQREALRVSQLSKKQYAIEQMKEKYGPYADPDILGKIYDGENPSRGGGRKKGGGSGDRPAQTFDNRVDLIREQGRAAFFTDLDRELISQLKELKSDPGLAKRTTDAIIGGGKLPERAQEMRDALELKKAGELAREARDQYGSLADVLPLVAERQRLLNIAVGANQITQETANKAIEAYRNALPQIQKAREGTDQLVDGIANVGWAGFEGGAKKAAEALRSLALEMAKTLTQAMLLKPLKDFLAGGTSGGGNPFSFLSGLFGGATGVSPSAYTPLAPGVQGPVLVRHGGGMVDGSGPFRSTHLGAFANAPRFHSGLKTGEFAAILEEGEAVATGRQQKGIKRMLSATPAPAVTVNQGNIIINEAPGVKATAQRQPNGDVVISMMDATNRRGAAMAGQGRGAFAGMIPNEVLAGNRKG